MKTFGKKGLLILTAVILIFSISCSKGPGGASGTTGLTSLSFQDGIFPSDAYAGTSDTDIISGSYAGSNFGTSTGDTAGSVSGIVYRALVKFDLSSVVPSNITVQKAYLTVSLNSTMDSSINAYALTGSWVETQATWNSSATGTGWTTPGGDFSTLEDSQPITSTTLKFALSPALVQSWITSPSTNYGIMLKNTDETSGQYVNVYSRENSPATSRPMLTIYYSLP